MGWTKEFLGVCHCIQELCLYFSLFRSTLRLFASKALSFFCVQEEKYPFASECFLSSDSPLIFSYWSTLENYESACNCRQIDIYRFNICTFNFFHFFILDSIETAVEFSFLKVAKESVLFNSRDLPSAKSIECM